MATFAQIGAATLSSGFELRVRVACFVVAQQVRDEAKDTPNHAARLTLANQLVTEGSEARQRQFLWAVAAAPAIADTVKTDTDPTKVRVDATDEQIQTAVAASWDAIAGWGQY